jgi:hypothetical protein
MKVWNGYGSEHSTNLKMIGRFRDAGEAKATEELFQRLQRHVGERIEGGTWQPGEGDDMDDPTYEFLRELKVWSMGPQDIENFAYDYSLERDGSDLILTTDENEVAGFLKLFIDKDAKVEVYSLHTHDNTGARKSD